MKKSKLKKDLIKMLEENIQLHYENISLRNGLESVKGELKILKEANNEHIAQIAMIKDEAKTIDVSNLDEGVRKIPYVPRTERYKGK